MLNRSVLFVRPKQPFLDWAASLDDSGLVPDVNSERTVYLVPEFESDDEAKQVLEVVFEDVFENELIGCYTDESRWPLRRDYETFLEWFSIELHSVVEDLCDYELIDDE